MPNHVTNILTFTGPQEKISEMLGKIQFQNSPGTLDFNKIIPMPESLEMNSGSITNEAIVSYMRAVNPETPVFDDAEKLPFNDYMELLQKVTNAVGILYPDRVKDITPELVQLGSRYVDNIRQYGCSDWYDWRIRNWGTKWNSYDGGFCDDNKILFLTAWSCPQEIIQKLAEMYPEICIEHLWADEDYGYNCGKAVYENGQLTEEFIPDGGSDEADEIADSVFSCDIINDESEELEPEM